MKRVVAALAICFAAGCGGGAGATKDAAISPLDAPSGSDAKHDSVAPPGDAGLTDDQVPNDFAIEGDEPIAAPNLLDFGEVATGETSAPQSVQVGGRGTWHASIVGAAAADFVIAKDLCAGITLDRLAHCEVQIAFRPTDSGVRSATLKLENTPSTLTVELTGGGVIGPARLTIKPAQVDFGSTPVGCMESAAHASVEVTNTGGTQTGPLALVVADPFSVLGGDCWGVRLSPKAWCNIDLGFAPTQAGVQTGTLEVSAAPTATVTAALLGTGVTVDYFFFQPVDGAFGDVAVNTKSALKMFTVSNLGSKPLPMVTAELIGVSPDEFAIVTNTCTAALGPTESCAIGIAFQPKSAGTKTALLIGHSGCASGSVALSGAGR